MARQRMIKPDIWTDEGFLNLSIPARLLFIGMISGADDEGRGSATDRCLKARVFPSDDLTLLDVRKIRCELAENVNVKFYEVDGREYYQLTKWGHHQRVDHPVPSTCPPPGEGAGIAREDAGIPRANELVNELVNESMNKKVSTSSAPKRNTASVPKVTFNTIIQKWENITEEMLGLWEKAYPACDMERELTKMAVWMLANPKKAPKSNYKRFIASWLSRTQDKGGTR